jgi:hypothetical protein
LGVALYLVPTPDGGYAQKKFEAFRESCPFCPKDPYLKYPKVRQLAFIWQQLPENKAAQGSESLGSDGGTRASSCA